MHFNVKMIFENIMYKLQLESVYYGDRIRNLSS